MLASLPDWSGSVSPFVLQTESKSEVASRRPIANLCLYVIDQNSL